jgi:hypothetical protein
VDVRDKPAFLRQLMRELAGDAHLSLEGDLQGCEFLPDQVVTREELGVLKRNTLAPRLDFVILRLAPSTVDPIFSQISAVGLSSAIIHVQIESSGVVELGAYDNFHSECVVTGSRVPSTLLSELKTKNIIRAFGDLNKRRQAT